MLKPEVPDNIEFNTLRMDYPVGVVIPTDHAREHLPYCLKALEQQAVVKLEIVVADLDSGDGTEQYLRENHPDIKFINAGPGPGHARAINLGRAALTGRPPFVAVIRPWVQIRYDCLLRMVRDLLKAKAGLVVPRLMDAHQTERLDCAGMFMTHYLNPTPLFRGKDLPPRFHIPSRVMLGCGNITLYRADLMQQNGNLDEDCLGGWEYWEYMLRAYRFGYECVFSPLALAYRTPIRSQDPWGVEQVFYHCRGALPTAIKLLPFLDLLVYLPLFFASRFKVLIHFAGGLRLGSALKGEGAALALVFRMWKKRKGLPRHDPSYRLLHQLFRKW